VKLTSTDRDRLILGGRLLLEIVLSGGGPTKEASRQLKGGAKED